MFDRYDLLKNLMICLLESGTGVKKRDTVISAHLDGKIYMLMHFLDNIVLKICKQYFCSYGDFLHLVIIEN